MYAFICDAADSLDQIQPREYFHFVLLAFYPNEKRKWDWDI